MSITSEIARIKNRISSVYQTCSSKGATLPETQNSANLAACINSLTTGGGGTLVLNREVADGVYQMPTTSFTWSLPSTATDIGDYGMYRALSGCTGLTSVDLSSLTTVSGNYAMQYAFTNCTGLTSVDLSSLRTISSGGYAMQYAFHYCTSLTSVDLSSLTIVGGNEAMGCAFSGCTGLTGALDLSSLTTVNGSNTMYHAFSGCRLTSVDLSSLTTISGVSAMQSAFQDCTRLTDVNFNSLQTIGVNSSSTNYGHFSSCFNGCTNLTSLTFPNLRNIYCTGGTTYSYGTFALNNKVQKMYFPKLNRITYGSGASSINQSACTNLFYGCASLTELHFAAANKTAIEASPGYSTAWGRGAYNVTIYFDL